MEERNCHLNRMISIISMANFGISPWNWKNRFEWCFAFAPLKSITNICTTWGTVMWCDVKMGGPPWLGPRRGCSLIHVTTPARLWPPRPQQADRLEPDYASMTGGLFSSLFKDSEGHLSFEHIDNPLKTNIVSIIDTICSTWHHRRCT